MKALRRSRLPKTYTAQFLSYFGLVEASFRHLSSNAVRSINKNQTCYQRINAMTFSATGFSTDGLEASLCVEQRYAEVLSMEGVF